MMVSKVCTRCGEDKSIENYSKGSGRGGRKSQCKPCISVVEHDRNTAYNVARRKQYAEDADYRERVRRTNRLMRYGLTHEAYVEMLERQGGRCAACGTDDPGKQDWHVDHDHACCANRTGRTCGKCTRALLCGPCNLGIGHMKDDPVRLMAAAAYLLQFEDVLANAG